MEYNYHEPKKYYWLSYTDNDRFYDTVTDLDPFEFINELNISQTSLRFYRIMNYNTITVERYNLYQELNNK